MPVGIGLPMPVMVVRSIIMAVVMELTPGESLAVPVHPLATPGRVASSR
jgi:hypothetical protein